eukprot:Mrub_06626.p1 GENE.Mrub_06626~~Mrub_06626.p1  ORF type:complete len:282 (+),score=46.89 Mrub_06626:91-846(+)
MKIDNLTNDKRVSFQTDDDIKNDDTIKKRSSILSRPQYKRRMSIKKDDLLSAEFLMSAQKPCGFKIYIDELLLKLPYEAESENNGDLEKRMQLFRKLDKENHKKLSLKDIYGLKKHLLISNNFNCELLLKYAFHEAIDRIEDSETNDITYIEYTHFRIVLVYLMYFFSLIHLFYELLQGGEHEITMETFMENRILLEYEGFDMDKAIEVFKDVDIDGSGKIDLLEFLKYTIKLKTEPLELDPDVDLSNLYK